MLTERIVRDAKSEGKARTLWDREVAGLGLQITQGGKKNYVLRYRAAGRKRQAILCRAGEASLREVRKRAGEELLRIRSGESDPLERQREAREAPTVGDLCDRFLNEHAPARVERGRMSPRTLKEYRYQIGHYVLPPLDRLRVEDVKRLDIERAVTGLKPITRNRVLALLSRLMSYAESVEWRRQNDNPCRHVERSREEARDRTLSGAELAALAAALSGAEERHPAPVAAIRFAITTGLRIGEILAVRWVDVDMEGGRLILPSTKTGRRIHDLPSPAAAVLAGIPHVGEFVFSTRGDARMTYSHVRKVFVEIVGKAGLQDVRLHDLRRGYMTQAAMAGVTAHVLRDLMGHRSAQVADKYIRSLGDPVRRARELTSQTLAAMMEDGAVLNHLQN
ncbi:MAG: tyrosine-type recombinase/integrase [Alphaproteobacteria bacterium]|nr:tyrosine-type recombinase/integrase [Alphaproteobacteria bacterium]